MNLSINGFPAGRLERLRVDSLPNDKIEAIRDARAYLGSCKPSDDAVSMDRRVVAKMEEVWPTKTSRYADTFLHPKNQWLVGEWRRLGFDPKIVAQHPEFAQFLVDSYIAESMAHWGDQIVVDEGIPQILVEGKHENWTEAKELYCGQKYFGGGQGLVIPEDDALPVVTVTKNDSILSLAQKFQRPGKRTSAGEYVLQVITPHNGDPYFCLIAPNGDTKYAQFYRKGLVTYLEDSSESKRVTHIAITEEEAGFFEETVLNYEENYRYLTRNSVSFIKSTLEKMHLVEPRKISLFVDLNRDVLKWQKAQISTENVSVPKKKVKIKKYTPGFGTPITNENALRIRKCQILSLIAIASVGMALSATLIGAFIFTGSLAFEVIGILGLVLTVGFIATPIFYFLHKRLYPSTYKYTLDLETTLNNEHAGASLGERVQNDVLVTEHSTESYLHKLELIRSAKRSVEQSFNFTGGEHFREVLSVLEGKLEKIPDFKVHLIMSIDLLTNDDKQRLAELKTKYKTRFNYLVTNRLYSAGLRSSTEENHVKALVVDGKYFVVGGSGLTEKMDREEAVTIHKNESKAHSFVDQAFRDTDLVGCGPTAKTIRGQFFNLYQVWSNRMEHKLEENEGLHFDLGEGGKADYQNLHQHERLVKNATLRFLVGGPEHKEENPISKAYRKLIERAQEEIRIANLYINPAEEIYIALKNAKKLGKKIRGVINGMGEKSPFFHLNFVLANHNNYDLFSEVHEDQSHDRCYHKKVATFDKRIGVIGSYNLGTKSAYCDNECVLVVENAEVASQLNQRIDKDERDAKLIYSTIEKVDKRPYFTKIFGVFYSALSHFVA